MTNNFNSSNILFACRQGNIRLIKFLIKNGKDPFKKIKIGNSYIIPIHFYGTDNRLITEEIKNTHIEEIKKMMIEHLLAKEFESLFFAEELETLFSASTTA